MLLNIAYKLLFISVYYTSFLEKIEEKGKKR